MGRRTALAAIAVPVLTAGLAAGAAAPGPPRVLAAAATLRGFGFCPDGRTIAGQAETAFRIEWPSGRATPWETDATRAGMPPCEAPAFGYSPDGRWRVTTSGGTLTVHDRSSGTSVRTVDAHLGDVTAAAFSPDGAWLASAGEDDDVNLWRTGAWTKEATISEMTHAPFALVWAPDGKTLYAAGASRTVTAWRAGTWTRLRESAPEPFALAALAISPDGTTVASGGVDPTGFGHPGAMATFDAATLQKRTTLATPSGLVGIAFSPDGRAVVGLVLGRPGLLAWSLE
jgi:WD40 repeat protein